MTIALILMLIALGLFVADAVGVSARINLTALGLAFMAASFAFQQGV